MVYCCVSWAGAISVDQLRRHCTSCKSAEDWLTVIRTCEAKLQTTSMAHRCEQLSELYYQSFQVFVIVFC